MKIGDLGLAIQKADGGDVTEEFMEELLDVIIEFVEKNGCIAGGGFFIADEDEWGELKPKDRRNPPCGCHAT